MSTRDVGVFEMMWDCPGCETKGLLGKTHRFCPNCGAPQAADKRYFPPKGQEVAVADHVFTGVDWKCPGCDTPNSNAAHFCGGCGAPREGDAKAVGLKTEAAPVAPPAPPKKGLPMVFIALAGLALLVCVGLVGANFLFQKDVALTVASRAWERTIQVEAYGPQSREGWCDELPTGATETRRFQAERSTREIPDGETCVDKKVDQGDGTFKAVQECTPKTRKEPVMGDKCAYTVLDWAPGRVLKAKGGAPPANWPDVTGLAPGTERAGEKSETFTVSLKGEDGSHECEVDEARFGQMAEGTRWGGKVGGLTGNVDCGALVPAK